MTQPRVVVEQESDTPRGWSFSVRIEDEHATHHRTVRLSWVDHEYWSKGGTPPADVVAAILRFLLEHGGLDRLGDSFDAASARRLHPSLDREIAARL